MRQISKHIIISYPRMQNEEKTNKIRLSFPRLHEFMNIKAQMYCMRNDMKENIEYTEHMITMTQISEKCESTNK